LLKAYVRRMAGRFRFFAPAPMIVLHLKDDPEGGFTRLSVVHSGSWHWGPAHRA
jgi:hypothetical protein